MSVIDRIRNRRVVTPTVTLELKSGAKLEIERFSQMELERGGALARSRLREEKYDPQSAEWSEWMVARMIGIGEVALSHMKGWTLPEPAADFAFNKENARIFIAEMSEEERLEVGLEYFKAVEAKEDSEKKILALFLQNLSNGSQSASDGKSSSPILTADDAPKSGESRTEPQPVTPDPAATPG